MVIMEIMTIMIIMEIEEITIDLMFIVFMEEVIHHILICMSWF